MPPLEDTEPSDEWSVTNPTSSSHDKAPDGEPPEPRHVEVLSSNATEPRPHDLRADGEHDQRADDAADPASRNGFVHAMAER